MSAKKSNVDSGTGTTTISTILSEKIISEKTNICYAPIKKDIIDYFNKNKNHNLYLFSEDTINNEKIEVKQFYGIDYKIVYLLSKKKKFHLYENFEENEKIKLFIDIDIKDFDKNIDRDNYFDEIIDNSINLYTDELKKYDIINPQIIILKSSSDTKLSSHIIFNDVIFDDVYYIKSFFEKLNSDLINNNIIDKSVYKTACFRMLWNSKLGKNINLEYYKSINYKYTTDKQLFYDCLLRNIPEKHQYVKINKKIDKKIDKIKDKTIDIKTDSIHIMDNEIEHSNFNFTINEIENLLNILSLKRCDNYDEWLNVGFCLYNINNNYLLLWEKWSQQSVNYQKDECEKKWNKFKKNKDGIKIGSLLSWAKNDNAEKYDEFIKNKKMDNIIKTKYPNENLILGNMQVINNKNSFIHLKNKECLIKGCIHADLNHSMYIDIVDKYMTIRCRHSDCFGKSYPVNHIIMNKYEMNNIFYGDVTINISNNDDDLVEFQQIDIYENSVINELVFNSLNGKPSQLAEIIFYYYKDDYIYGEDNEWYMFDNHKWKNVGSKNTKLRKSIQHKLKDLYKQLYKYYKENDCDKKKLVSLKLIMDSFGETIMKNNIMTELIDLYIEEKNPKRDFIKKLDSNQSLIGFENGIYDLDTCTFRNGKQTDYITLSTGYDYCEKHTDKYNNLIQFLEDIQPNKDERDYMLTYLSIALFGNLLELFTILTGCGRNGKSKLIELLKITFGDYFGSVQSQMFTRPRPDANSPDPGLLNLRKKRLIIASEPEKNCKLNSGFIKFITGRDSTTLRNCHSNDMIDFTAKFITLLICNDIPDCDDIDNAFSKRLRCLNFPTEFVNEPNKENQKKIDVNINKNFDYWKLDFMLLLIEYYKKYIEKNELKPTPEILKWTNQYQENTDLYLQFINENTEENKEGHIHCATLYDTFKFWFKNNNPNSKIPSNKEFINNLKKYKTVCKVYVDNKSQLGIKNLQLIN
jgi:P4 family phage/plasmid primase-like protien